MCFFSKRLCLKRRFTFYLATITLFVITGGFCCASGDEKFTIYPQDYAKTVGGEKVVGEYGKLIEIEDEDGEAIEVIEFAVPRAVQREKDVLLFSTIQPPERTTNFLVRSYLGWVGGSLRELVFREPDMIDRTIYRHGSSAWDRKVSGLYETAVLNGVIARIAWFAARAETNNLPQAPLARLLVEHNEYLKMRRYQVRREGTVWFWRGLLANAEKIPSWKQTLEESRKRLTSLQARQKALAEELESINAKLRKRVEPHGDPSVRRRDVLRLEEYEARADARYEAHLMESIAALMERVTSNAVSELGVAINTDKSSLEVDAAGLAKAVAFRLKEEEERNKKTADVGDWILAAAREVLGLMKVLSAAQTPDDKARQLIEAWKNAEAAKPLEVAAEEAVAA